MQRFERIFSQVHKTNKGFKLLPLISKRFSTANSSANVTGVPNETEETITESTKKDSFTQEFDKYTSPKETKDVNNDSSFATLLRHSNFMHLGDPEGKIVTGKIFQVINNDLYIDFGWKFHCVCSKPVKNSNDYVRGAKVRLRIKSLELSTKFLGNTKDVTLLEADCALLGLISTPNQINKTTDSTNLTEAATSSTAAVQ